MKKFRWKNWHGPVDYDSMPPMPRQDNKTYINHGSGGSNWGWLRRPKKVRKTAWKRFYKLFPKLKWEDKK